MTIKSGFVWYKRQKLHGHILKTGRERGRGREEKQLDGAREDCWKVISLYRLVDGINQNWVGKFMKPGVRKCWQISHLEGTGDGNMMKRNSKESN